MSDPPDPNPAYSITPTEPLPYSSYQAFGIFLVTFSPVPALAVCILRVYSRRLAQGLGLGEPIQKRLLRGGVTLIWLGV